MLLKKIKNKKNNKQELNKQNYNNWEQEPLNFGSPLSWMIEPQRSNKLFGQPQKGNKYRDFVAL